MFLSDLGLDLLQRMLVYDPEKRISAEEALKHPWFSEAPLPAGPESMPDFPALNEISREQLRKKRKNSLDEEQRKQREEMHEKEDRYFANSLIKKNY